MFTATIVNKEFDGAALKLTVEFTDGEKTVTESVIPQNEEGYNHWLKSRLETFNSGREIDSKINIGDTAEFQEPQKEEVVDAPEIVALKGWIKLHNRYTNIYTTLVVPGILPVGDPDLVALKKEVQTKYKPEYLNYF